MRGSISTQAACSANNAHVRLDVDAGSSGVHAAGAGADDARVVVDTHCQALCAGLYMQTWLELSGK